MSPSTAEIMSRGMKCLMEQLGVVDAERFVATVIREKFDYTRWQREYFDGKSQDLPAHFCLLLSSSLCICCFFWARKGQKRRVYVHLKHRWRRQG